MTDTTEIGERFDRGHELRRESSRERETLAMAEFLRRQDDEGRRLKLIQSGVTALALLAVAAAVIFLGGA